ncbi:MAG TPA: long-chain fatty acid--CoA ligase [Bacteroidales bacterium]|nr:long-chain fatty acid--CoA ligase [Bacteroidales bacterium]
MEIYNLPQLFESMVSSNGDNVLLWEKKGKQYQGTTYKEAKERIIRLASGFLSMGLTKGDRVALISEGRNDWVVSELALLYIGAISVPLSVKLDEPGDLIFRINHSGCKGIIVSGNHHKKVFNILDKLATVEFVLLLDNPEKLPEALGNKKVVVIDQLLAEGEALLLADGRHLEKITQSIGPNDYANICYTSGTTADPKGIILTHRNYLSNVEQGCSLIEIPSYYTSLHILPWDHSFAHTVGIYALIKKGASLASVQVGKSLNETLRNIPINIKEVRPHFLLSVPALAKNFRKNIEKGVRDKGAIAWGLFNLGLKVAYAYNREGHNKGTGWRVILKPLYKLFDKILFSKIQNNFGGRLKYFVGGGALLDIDLQRFYYAIGIPMYQGYGLTEASPIISSNTPDFHKMGSSGKIVPNLDLKICNEAGVELPVGQQGEIVVRGENVMAGYWANETATKETLRNGWLHTGDLGYVDSDGYLYVLGRSKSLLIGSDGEKYSPEGIEEYMVEKIPFIDQMMLYNNQNPYTVGLVVINKPRLKDFLEKSKLTPNTEDGQVAALKKIRQELDRFLPGGDQAGVFPTRWLPAAVAILDEPFSEQNKLMNSTMKIVRPAIVKHYQELLNHLYTPDGKEIMNNRNKEVIARLS